jgi:hypothetical protein
MGSSKELSGGKIAYNHEIQVFHMNENEHRGD